MGSFGFKHNYDHYFKEKFNSWYIIPEKTIIKQTRQINHELIPLLEYDCCFTAQYFAPITLTRVTQYIPNINVKVPL